MPTTEQWRKWVSNPSWFQLYGGRAQSSRYTALITRFEELFGAGENADISLFSTPGRTEVGGNHTDHNHGLVLAAGVSVDMIAAVRPTDDGIITVHSEGYRNAFEVDCSETEPQPREAHTTAALVRGVIAGLRQQGFAVGGCNMVVQSEVLRGSGLSSSAAFEVLTGCIQNGLYNQNKIPGLTLAKIAQFAENVYFGKPCGLMDQTACALGGFVTIDFADPKNPVVRNVACDFSEYGYHLVITDTGGDHARLTEAYAEIGRDMRSVAQALGGSVLRDVDRSAFEEIIPVLRNTISDRAIMRAGHYFEENQRVLREVEALDNGDIQAFLAAVIESGESSWRLLQNCSTGTAEQPVALGLYESEKLLRGSGAWRVHGGGFAGTIQAFVPTEQLAAYTSRMRTLFGDEAPMVLSIRPVGATEISLK